MAPTAGSDALLSFCALLIGIEQIKPGKDIRSRFQACCALIRLQSLAAAIFPAALPHEGIPYLDVLFAGLASVLETPTQDLQIGATTQRALLYCAVPDFEESGATRVEIVPLFAPRVVIGGQHASRLESDFVEHPAEVDNATNFIICASQSWNLHVCFFRLTSTISHTPGCTRRTSSNQDDLWSGVPTFEFCRVSQRMGSGAMSGIFFQNVRQSFDTAEEKRSKV